MKLSNPEKEWFEIWCVEGINYIPAYLVVVAPNPENQNEIIVLDLAKSEIIYKSQEYEDVRNWLTEDDFRFVNGREFNYVL